MSVRIFKDEKEFMNKFEEYLDYCNKNKRLANIAGFSVYCKICRDSFYAQKDYYPETFSMINDILEDYTLNADINHLLKMFYLKCKFKYNDHYVDNLKSDSRTTIVDDLPDDDSDGENNE